MEFQRYPMHMSHPHAKPATISGPLRDERGRVIGQQPAGKPATYPPVVVNNRDQELQYASKGYAPNGVADPDAYMRAVMGADEPQTYHNVEYPKWLYRVTDGELESKLVKSQAEEIKLGKGWHKTPDLAHVAVEEPELQVEEELEPAAASADAPVPMVQKKPKKRKMKRAKKAKVQHDPSAPSAGA